MEPRGFQQSGNEVPSHRPLSWDPAVHTINSQRYPINAFVPARNVTGHGLELMNSPMVRPTRPVHIHGSQGDENRAPSNPEFHRVIGPRNGGAASVVPISHGATKRKLSSDDLTGRAKRQNALMTPDVSPNGCQPPISDGVHTITAKRKAELEADCERIMNTRASERATLISKEATERANAADARASKAEDLLRLAQEREKRLQNQVESHEDAMDMKDRQLSKQTRDCQLLKKIQQNDTYEHEEVKRQLERLRDSKRSEANKSQALELANRQRDAAQEQASSFHAKLKSVTGLKEQYKSISQSRLQEIEQLKGRIKLIEVRSSEAQQNMIIKYEAESDAKEVLRKELSQLREEMAQATAEHTKAMSDSTDALRIKQMETEHRHRTELVHLRRELNDEKIERENGEARLHTAESQLEKERDEHKAVLQSFAEELGAALKQMDDDKAEHEQMMRYEIEKVDIANRKLVEERAEHSKAIEASNVARDTATQELEDEKAECQRQKVFHKETLIALSSDRSLMKEDGIKHDEAMRNLTKALQEEKAAHENSIQGATAALNLTRKHIADRYWEFEVNGELSAAELEQKQLEMKAMEGCLEHVEGSVRRKDVVESGRGEQAEGCPGDLGMEGE